MRKRKPRRKPGRAIQPTEIQVDLWGNPFEELKPKAKPEPKGEVVALQFEGNSVRMVEVNGQPWWVATDVCRVLGLSNTAKAIAPLEESEKGITRSNTPGGEQNLITINEPGLYRLLFKSEKPEAKRVQTWVFTEVLPAIRKNGVYSLRPRSTRFDRIKKRLKCSDEIAGQREKATIANKAFNAKLASVGAKPADFAEANNAAYRGAFDMTAQELREQVGLPSHRSPMDAMGLGPLLQLSHAKWLATERIKAKAQAGVTENDIQVIEQTTRHVVESDMRYLNQFGRFVLGVTNNPERGKIIDVIPKQIA